ncbi:tripartite tricarboxylate transporter substrate binding protein [Roseomonas eburnea]|uniref:Tripartite tricarboxylate transporter substrate binding protein n=1 Tax=Neoroseomonas eburnea TaxID=1346889 RepID=A0A9X9XC25_9PROT|nr:tripartite tricarboxylate transporter substrate binding protein [Neoroseomonas eburnea]MBR0681261.1 tripartite tricarboxylate transporter substrate binding protein [Neoroseomonas eburnea]
MLRRQLLLCAAALGIAPQARAQDGWPSRPVSLVVPYVPGGPSDLLARTLTQHLQARLGQPFVVENRTGANGAVAAQHVARQPADGHTLFVAASGIMTINPLVMPRIGYDPTRDFTPVTLAISTSNLLVVSPSVPATNLAELLAWLRANPDRASYGSSGIGSSEHLGMELFKQRTGTDMTHVPYPGGGAAVTDLVSGTLQLALLNMATVVPQVQAGRLRAIAVSGRTRHPLLPEVPTVIEAGVPDFVSGSWHSVVAPRGMAPGLLTRVHAEVTAALRMPEVAQRLAATGFSVEASSQAVLAETIETETTRWRDVVRRAGLATG